MTKMSQQKMTEMSQKKTKPLSSGVFRSLNQGTKLRKMLKHTAISSILVVMAVCFSILLVQRHVLCEISFSLLSSFYAAWGSAFSYWCTSSGLMCSSSGKGCWLAANLTSEVLVPCGRFSKGMQC